MRLGLHGIREFISVLEDCDNGIRDAKRIFIVSPYYTHNYGNNILISLVNKGVQVSVLLSAHDWDLGRNSISQPLIARLKNANGRIAVKKCVNLHAKIYIITNLDDSIDVWMGSSNFTYRADGYLINGNYPRN